MSKFSGWVSEQLTWLTGGLRNAWRSAISGSFFGPAPAYDKTRINYDMARQLYRNDGADSHLGAGFCKPIIDRAVEFIGMPTVTGDNEELVEEVNRAIDRHWKPQLIEMFRNSMRDSVTYVRVWQPLVTDKLTTDDERRACALTIIEPERITVVYDPQNPRRMIEVIIVTMVEFRDDVEPRPDIPRGTKPKIKEHEIWEHITPTKYRYYDRTMKRWIDEWERDNPAGFVPVAEVWNEYDSALSGGQSDLESVYPFVKAFHEVMRQALQAHAYHSTPKLRFKVDDVAAFLANNFPDVIDPETGDPKPGATIPWKGREVLFIGTEEDMGFIEVKSVLGDSKQLLEFLIDCIAVASETPEWAFMRVEGGTSSGNMNAQTIPFEKKIERKRSQFQEPIQMIVKMMLALNGNEPTRLDVLWTEIRVESLVTLTQAMQQFVMTLEVLLERKLISENTAREALRQFRVFKTMRAPSVEAEDAEDNLSLEERMAEIEKETAIEIARETPQPQLTTGNGNGNGGGRRKAAVSGRNGGGRSE